MASLGVCLANDGKKVLIVDFDPQGNLTKALGYRDPRTYKHSLKEALFNEMELTLPTSNTQRAR